MPIAIWFLLLFDKLLGRKPKVRSSEEQAKIDQATAGLRLYHFQGCPFCRKVRRDIRLLGLNIESLDILKDKTAFRALVDGGGKKQVPCLRIEEDGRVDWLYESRDISAFLRKNFT